MGTATHRDRIVVSEHDIRLSFIDYWISLEERASQNRDGDVKEASAISMASIRAMYTVLMMMSPIRNGTSDAGL